MNLVKTTVLMIPGVIMNLAFSLKYMMRHWCRVFNVEIHDEFPLLISHNLILSLTNHQIHQSIDLGLS